MTQQEARRIVRGLGLTLRAQDGEFRVSVPYSPAHPTVSESVAYYTNDLQDAVDTARAMATEPRAVQL